MCRSETIESMEITGTEFTLDKAAVAQGSLPLKETIRGAIGGGRVEYHGQ
jgi:hypothetical protein